MNIEDSMQSITRKTIVAEKGICKAIDHTIIRTDRIDIDHELETLDGYYCPTCNKFWREP